MACAVGTITFADAARERVTAEEDGITFKVDLFDDGRSNPYKVSFKQDGTLSTYRLDDDGKVAKINIGSDKYKVLPPCRWADSNICSIMARNKCLLSVGA